MPACLPRRTRSSDYPAPRMGIDSIRFRHTYDGPGGQVSERKEDLAARMRLVKAALDSEPVAVAVLRAPELRYLYSNNEMRRLAGRDLAGVLHTDAWPVSILERLTAILRRVAGTGEPWIERDTPWDLPRSPGAPPEHMFLTFEVSRVELGEGIYLLLTITETTDEVVMRQQRDVMAERMTEVLESVSDAVFALDRDWRLTYVNGHMAELCGTPPGELVGVEIWGALPSARGTEFERACQEALESGERIRLESEGGPFGGSFTARIYPAENGLVVYVADTSERTRARRALEQAHRRFDRVLDGTRDGFYIFDRDWRFVHVNQAIADAVRMPREDILGRRATDLFSIDPDSKIVREFTRAMNTGETSEFTAYYEGTDRWYEYGAIPIEDGLAVFVRDITERRREQAAIAEQARYSAALNAIDAEINVTLDVDAIMRHMIASASEAVDADISIVVMLDDEGWQVTHVDGSESGITGHLFAYDELPHATAALQNRSTIVIDDSSTDPRVDASIAEAMGLGSMLVVPLQRAEEVFGAIIFNRSIPPRPFSEAQVEFGTQLGHHVSLAVENAWLLARERAARERADDDAETANLLLTAAESLSSTLSVDDVTRTLQGLVARATGRNRVTILRRDKTDGAVNVLATTCPRAQCDSARYLSILFSPALHRVIETTRPEVADFPAGACEPSGLGTADHACELRRVLFVPLRRGSSVSGVLAVDEPGNSADFTEREVDIVAGLAAEAAAAIENAHLYESAQETARYSQALNEIDVDINSSLDFDTVMRRTLDRAASILSVDGARVGVVEKQGRWHITHACGADASTEGDTLPLDALPHGRVAIHSRQAIVVNDVSTDPRVPRERLASQGVGSVLVVPLLGGEKPMGVLFFNRHGSPRRFTDAQVDFARSLAAHVSLAVQNSRLYEAQREIADTLQEALLVMPEHVDGVEFAHLYRSAAEAARVGGDFYDLFTIDDHTAGVVIGDVSGKGLDAAVMTSLARNTIRAYSAERMAPASVLERAGDIMLASTERWVFMSVFYGVIDFEHGVITYCNAGHPAPVIVSPGAPLRTLDPTAAVAGAFKGTAYAQGHAKLQPGETLLLYTDGLIEARHEGDLYGEGRLHGVLASSGDLAPDQLVQRVVDDAERFALRLNDDVAVLAVRIRPD